MGRDDQPRWPRGTPNPGRGEPGPGPGRFRDTTPDWASQVAGRMGGRLPLAAYVGRDDFEVTGTAGGAQGRVEFRQYGDGRHLARKIYLAGGPRVWPEREVEVARVARAVGASVPETIQDGEFSILMDYIDGSPASQLLLTTRELDRLDPEGMRRIALLDMLVGNADRHNGNVMIDQDGRAWGIDHAFSFNASWFQPPSEDDEELEVPFLLLGYSRLILDETYDHIGAMTGWEQAAFTLRELEQVRQRLLALDGLDPDHLAGMLKVLDVLVSITPA